MPKCDSPIDPTDHHCAYFHPNRLSRFRDLARRRKKKERRRYILLLNKSLELVVEISPNLPRFVLADEAKLRQILINLVGNALKFTNQGKVQVQARLATESERNAVAKKLEQPGVWLNLTVQDSGTGIAEQNLERIFEPFFQVVNERNVQQGTGLGLAISKQYVQLMGGEILVQSIPDHGSIFSCLIPVHTTKMEEPSDSQMLDGIGISPEQLQGCLTPVLRTSALLLRVALPLR